MKRDLSIFDYIIISLISSGLVCLIYHYLYPIIGYSNLNDFYVGVSVYENHNKILDLLMFPLYILLFFGLVPIFKLIPGMNFKFNLADIKFNFSQILKRHKLSFLILQIVLSFGYVFLHPFDGNLYIPLLILILVLILASVFHSYINLYKKETAKISVLAVLPIIILLFGNNYNFGSFGFDIHHEGEKMTVWLMHSQFNMEYYKDVMMVHGFVDIIPSLLSKYVFGGISEYNWLLGRNLFDNLALILTVLCTYYIFKTNPSLIAFTMYRPYNIPQLYILSFLAFLKAHKNYFWIIAYIIFAFFGLFFWTTYGMFWLLASLPLAVYVCFKTPNKDIKISSSIILIFVLLFFNKNFIHNFALEAVNYIQSNLYSFGNDFSPIKFHQIPSDIIKLFALFSTPYFILKLVEELKNKNKNIEYIFLLIFAIFFACFSINYSLGRIDYVIMQRIRDISLTYLFSIVPYMLLVKNNDNLKIFKYCAILFGVFLVFTHIPNLKNWIPNTKPSFKTDTATLEVKSIIEKYSKSDSDFLDLNHGMNYFIFNKKMPIPYTSFYNIVNSKQVEKIADIEPNIILIKTSLQRFDDVYPSLRINKLYKNLITNPKYSTLKTKNNLFLIKKAGIKDLDELDKALSVDNLKQLPDAWQNSIKTLPLETVDYKYSIKNNEIIFDRPIKGTDIDLIELYTDKKNVNYKVKLNESNSVLKFNSKQNSVLFPFDNFPSWLLNENLKFITIQTDKQTEIKSVKFYKRK